MTAAVFEPLDKSSFRIGKKVVSGHFCDPPLGGTIKYIIEGTSDKRDDVYEHIFVHDFADVFPQDLPNGTSIHIQRPKSEFREIGFVAIKKVADQSSININLCFTYTDWHLPLNLNNFADRYSSTLRRDVDGVSDCYIERWEGGLFINCTITAAQDLSFYHAFQRAESRIICTYRKCLADIYSVQPSIETPPIPETQEVSGAKWWFRYVIVPMLGSGAVAAVAAGLMALLK